MKQDFIEKIYAGWLAKIIGIRLGAPVESWTYEKIRTVYGEVNGYLADYRDFAADDDSNGPIFLIRALELENRGRGYNAAGCGGSTAELCAL
ncbi:MAG: ADP-ribosylglycohydrolase family protein [Eisenbergiella massiliensis]